MTIKKKFLKTKPICKVTFQIPKEVAQSAASVNIVGEFNNWNESKTPMKSLKNGGFTVTLDLPVKNEYQFRYLIDHNRWENDRQADKYVPTPFGDSKNSVVIL